MTERAAAPEEIRRTNLLVWRRLLPWPLNLLVPQPEPEAGA